MTWTYGNDPSNSTRDAVRFLVGDTDTNDQLVTDEEIAFALSEASNAKYSAAVIVCEALIGKFARLADTSIESVKVSYSQRADGYKNLLNQLKLKAQTESGAFGAPKVGGVRDSEISAAREDTDRVTPIFEDGMFDNPSVKRDDRIYYDQE